MIVRLIVRFRRKNLIFLVAYTALVAVVFLPVLYFGVPFTLLFYLQLSHICSESRWWRCKINWKKCHDELRQGI